MRSRTVRSRTVQSRTGQNRAALFTLSFVVLTFGCKSTTKQSLAFFCGCSPCSTLIEEVGSERLNQFKIFYKGNTADCEAFRLRKQFSHVLPDPTGATASQYGSDTCPTLLIANPNGYEIIGNGNQIGKELLQRLKAGQY